MIAPVWVLVLVVVLGPSVAFAALMAGFRVWDGWWRLRAARRFDRRFAREAQIDMRHTAEPHFLGRRER